MQKLVMVLTILFTLSLVNSNITTASSTLTITLSTSKQTYNLGETVQIYGNLTLNGVIVTDGLVAIQINSPNLQCYILRTIETGTLTNQNWTAEILSVYTCDQYENPKTSFQRGTTAYAKITWKNNLQTPIYILVALYIEFPSNIPFQALAPVAGTINPGESSITVSIPIPSNAPLGTCMLYANLYDNWPKDSGTPYCPEKTTSFTITSTGSESLSEKPPQYNTLSINNFNLTFNLPKISGQMGNYTIFATSYYNGEKTSKTTSFNVTLIGDINHDGLVDIRDISIVGRAYGSTPEHERWNPTADLNKDNIVDIRDISTVGRDYGKSGTYYT